MLLAISNSVWQTDLKLAIANDEIAYSPSLCPLDLHLILSRNAELKLKGFHYMSLLNLTLALSASQLIGNIALFMATAPGLLLLSFMSPTHLPYQITKHAVWPKTGTKQWNPPQRHAYQYWYRVPHGTQWVANTTSWICRSHCDNTDLWRLWRWHDPCITSWLFMTTPGPSRLRSWVRTTLLSTVDNRWCFH